VCFGDTLDKISEILQYFFSGLTNGAIYALLALGFSIIFNATTIINFAQGEFVMLGALTVISLFSLGLGLPLAFVLAVAAVTLMGLAFERLAIRPAREATPISLIIITVGGGVLLKGLAMLFWGKDAYTLPPFSGQEPLRLAGATILPQSLWIIGLTLLLVAGLEIFLRFSLLGKAMRAASFNPRAARLVGIRVSQMVQFSFGLSAALGGAAGVMIAPITMGVYDMGTMLGLKGFCAAVIGGLGSIFGGVLGGLVLGVAEAFASGMLSSGYRDAVAFLILLLVLFFRPQGLIGLRFTRTS
jgi:branched-chain amino acid transport system permease protein